MRQKKRIMGHMCAAAALAITVTVGGVTALAPAASADVAVVSAATHSAAPSSPTHSAAPSSPQGPETRQVHPKGISSCVAWFTVRTAIPAQIIMNACSLVSLVPPTHDPMYLRLVGIAIGACAATMRVNGASYLNSVVGCGLSGLPTPFTQEQWCATTGGTACLNAWGGGPWVNDSTTGFESGDNHQNFFLSAVDDANGNPTGNYQLGFAGANDSWAGQCIGDAYNNSGDADTSLDGCGNSTGGGSGWGTNFTIGTSGCPDGEGWFHNNHWNGYLGPGGSANGSHFYLNKPTPYCFNIDFF